MLAVLVSSEIGRLVAQLITSATRIDPVASVRLLLLEKMGVRCTFFVTALRFANPRLCPSVSVLMVFQPS